ncbi:MAG: 16S rRNA (cytosine(1402)-N(4))-methyltransferase RsmH [Coprothermobacterota bacterium]|nr:16S rRNA (cytosine(1402)-N(4))-methyltransferase RsmH [Coprothermobacterota bacterium]
MSCPPPFHQPVMVAQCLEYLAPRENGLYLDCTVGGGGHAEALLGRSTACRTPTRLIGLDLDDQAILEAGARLAPFGDRVTLIAANFARTGEVLARLGVGAVDGLLADLGVSSWQFDQRERGFTFAPDVPLDMRMNQSGQLTAAEILNRWRLDELQALFQRSEVPRSGRLAGAIVVQRRIAPFRTSTDLLRLLEGLGLANRRTFHPATLVFQALRLATNREQENLALLLSQLPSLLKPGGRCVFLSYHSLEDRPVKQAFREREVDGSMHVLTRRVVRPSEEEVRSNPRARSAKLRAAERSTAL